MTYFSGIDDQKEYFKEFTCKGDFCIVGSDTGASKALEYVFTCKVRVDKLQLIAPVIVEDYTAILKNLVERKIEIEVYLVEDDKTKDSLHVKNLFQKFATIYYIKTKD